MPSKLMNAVLVGLSAITSDPTGALLAYEEQRAPRRASNEICDSSSLKTMFAVGM